MKEVTKEMRAATSATILRIIELKRANGVPLSPKERAFLSLHARG